MKIGLVCTHGGHLTETLQLLEAFQGHQIFIATHHSARDSTIQKIAPAYFMESIELNLWRMVYSFWWAWNVIRKERPDLIISLGAQIAIPFFIWSKLLGIKTIYIESWCRTEDLSLTGKLVYPIVDAFYVQWPQLVKVAGKKAQFRGAVI